MLKLLALLNDVSLVPYMFDEICLVCCVNYYWGITSLVNCDAIFLGRMFQDPLIALIGLAMHLLLSNSFILSIIYGLF